MNETKFFAERTLPIGNFFRKDTLQCGRTKSESGLRISFAQSGRKTHLGNEAMNMQAIAVSTRHFEDRAFERGLPTDVEDFIFTWGEEIEAPGAASYVTVVRRALPGEVRWSR